jgi:gliding motility-associated-like protein
VVQFSKDTLTLPTGFLLNLAPAIINAADPGILPIAKYTWTPSRDLTCNDDICSSPIALIKDNVCYSVKATNIYGCSGSDTICVKVFCQSSQIFIPNAFTPKGDIPGNRRLVVRASGVSSVRSFRVFNRWGRIVFEKNNFPPNSPDFGWDGTVNGKPADPGVYVYTAEVICENGVPYTFKGNVTLL